MYKQGHCIKIQDIVIADIFLAKELTIRLFSQTILNFTQIFTLKSPICSTFQN